MRALTELYFELPLRGRVVSPEQMAEPAEGLDRAMLGDILTQTPTDPRDPQFLTAVTRMVRYVDGFGDERVPEPLEIEALRVISTVLTTIREAARLASNTTWVEYATGRLAQIQAIATRQ
jgi:hypothetical protein